MDLTQHVGTDEYILLCHNCGYDYLHQSDVEIFNRLQEDSEEGLHLMVDGVGFEYDRNMEGNPSWRRDGLVIRFWCESCCATTILTILQHKGQTFLHHSNAQQPKTMKELYHAYLKSEEWDLKRKSKLKEAGYRCQLCNAQSRLSVHHRTYERIFDEEPGDLIALCESCHAKFHGHEVDGEIWPPS